MTREMFFPTDTIGHHVAKFNTFSDVSAILSFVLSLLASSLGMTKFVIFGPFVESFSSNESTKSLILNGACVMLTNLMFSLRLFAIEASFFAYYQSYRPDFTSYENVLPFIKEDKLRILFYLLPSVIPIVTNNIRLAMTYNGSRKLYLNYPHLFILPGFTPFMYEGVEDVDINGKKITNVRIWKRGTIVNAIYLFFIAPIVLLIAEYIRGTITWDPTPNPEKLPYKYTNSMIKTKYGNTAFAIATLTLSLVLVVFLYARLFGVFKSERVSANLISSDTFLYLLSKH